MAAAALGGGGAAGLVVGASIGWAALHGWGAVAGWVAARRWEATPREARPAVLRRGLLGFAAHAVAAATAGLAGDAWLAHWVGGLRADPIPALLQWVWVAPVCGVLGRPSFGVLAGALATLAAVDAAAAVTALRG